MIVHPISITAILMLAVSAAYASLQYSHHKDSLSLVTGCLLVFGLGMLGGRLGVLY
ncbi:hypothetical protein AEGHOMDF_1108 [Methylobacterium soli]|nr:hypothetical protein AEGHOMDF_1108 [Methylobacterium soli]